MSDQEEGKGHHVTTMHAVRHLFERIPGERLLGQTPQEFFNRLDAAQGQVDGMPFADHILPHYLYKAFGVVTGSPHEVIVSGPGTTILPSALAPEAQTAHALSNPHLNAQQNLEAMKTYLVTELMAAKEAHARGDVQGEFMHLGRVTHLVEDSYSQAHMLRDPSRPGDPEAHVNALLNFSTLSWVDSNTHEKSFDSVPTVAANNDLARMTDQAGPQALGRIFATYVQNVDSADLAAVKATFQSSVQSYFTGQDAVTFDDHHAAGFKDYVAQHYGNEVSMVPVQPNAPEKNQSENQVPHASQEYSSPVAGDPGQNYTPADPSPNFTPAEQDLNYTPGPAASTQDRSPATSGQQGAAPAQGDAEPTVRPQAAAGQVPTDQIFHPTAGAHTDVKSVRDAHGYREYVYGEGGSTGQTAREHAANPHQPHNWQSQHGADVVVPPGTPIYAVFDGKIGSQFGVERGHEKDGPDSSHHGNRLTIEGASNKAFYQHLERFADGIAPGAEVIAGQLIGYSGTGGGIHHLHIALEHGNTDQILRDASISRAGADQHHAGATNTMDAGALQHASQDVTSPAHFASSGEGYSLGALQVPGPANGRFYTGDELTHINYLMSLQIHPEKLFTPGDHQLDPSVLVDPASVHHHAVLASSTGVDQSIQIDPSHAPTAEHDLTPQDASAFGGHEAQSHQVPMSAAGRDHSGVQVDPSLVSSGYQGGHSSHDASVLVDPATAHGSETLGSHEFSAPPGAEEMTHAAASSGPHAGAPDDAICVDPASADSAVPDHVAASGAVDPSHAPPVSNEAAAQAHHAPDATAAASHAADAGHHDAAAAGSSHM